LFKCQCLPSRFPFKVQSEQNMDITLAGKYIYKSYHKTSLTYLILLDAVTMETFTDSLPVGPVTRFIKAFNDTRASESDITSDLYRLAAAKLNDASVKLNDAAVSLSDNLKTSLPALQWPKILRPIAPTDWVALRQWLLQFMDIEDPPSVDDTTQSEAVQDNNDGSKGSSYSG
jgi:hypothetical protein